VGASKKMPHPIGVKPTAAQLREHAAVRRIMVNRRGLPAWEAVPMYGLVVTRKRHMLTVVVLQLTPTAVNVTVVQALKPTATKLTRRNATKEVEKVFDDHVHDVVGTFDSMSNAFKAGDAYADAWRKGGMEKARCTCENIRAR
jgi:hypothetical protein